MEDISKYNIRYIENDKEWLVTKREELNHLHYMIDIERNGQIRTKPLEKEILNDLIKSSMTNINNVGNN